MPNPLVRKIGPLPVWAWGLGALVFVGVVWYMRKNMGDSTDTTITDSDYGQEPIAGEPPLTGGNGSGGSGGGSYYDDPLPPIPPLPPIDYSIPDPIYEYPQAPYQPIAEPIVQDTGETETKVVTAPVAKKQTSFLWGGKTWTKGQLAAFRKHLKSKKGSIYAGPNGFAVWATNHPKVIADFGWPKK